MDALWKWLDGKKTTIAGAWWAIMVPAALVIWPEGAPENVDKVIQIVGLALTYLGLGHKALKGVSA